MSKIKQFMDALNQAYTDAGVNGVAVARQAVPESYAVHCEFAVGVEDYLIFKNETGWSFVRDFPLTEYIHKYGEPR